MEHLLEEFEVHSLIEWRLFGLDLSITKAVIMLWIACAVVFLLVWLASRRMKLVPSGMQNLMEACVEFVRKNMIIEIMGKEGLPYFPFIATIFLFVLVSNLLGLIPGSYTATSKTGTTGAWALIVFIAYHAIGIKKQGFLKYFKSFVPSGIPVAMLILMLPIEIVSHLARPFSLAVRLFANMLAGHMVIAVFTFMAITAGWYMKWLPFAGVVIMNLFEIFVGFIQAYIFAILAAIYISGAIHPEH